MIIVIVMMKRRVGMGRVKQTRMRSETTVRNLIKDEILGATEKLSIFRNASQNNNHLIIYKIILDNSL